MIVAPTSLLLALAIAAIPGGDDLPDDLRLNQIQVVGTHNSYHIAPWPSVMRKVAAISPALAESLDYTHRPLAEQFERLAIRQVELDVFADPDGGLFADPLARRPLSAEGADPGPDPNEGGVLDRPGPKVLHVQDIDYRTSAPTLADALCQVRDWSLDHPRHVPILVLIELKDQAHPGLMTPRPIDEAAIDAVEAVIRRTFEPGHLFTPDDLRGEAEGLPEAILTRGWARLGEVRGKVLLALDNTDRIRDLYLRGHPALGGRAMFADAGSTASPAAAWFKRNDPIAQGEEIRSLVRDGFLVRTRADANTVQARTGSIEQRDRALAVGAQYVSTDYPEPDRRFTGYRVTLPGGAEARVNPVSGPEPIAP
jgi:hypothetical protein